MAFLTFAVAGKILLKSCAKEADTVSRLIPLRLQEVHLKEQVS